MIFYDNVSGISAARGVWLLLYFSHEKVCMLDGGFEKWKREGYPVEVKSNALKNSRFKGKINSTILADANEVKKAINKKNVVILDSRSREEYDGSEVRADKKRSYPISNKY